jgi:hypothetical protein
VSSSLPQYTVATAVSIIVVGIVSLLSVVTLRKDFAGATGADDASLVPPASRWSRFVTGRSCSGPASWPASGPGCCWLPDVQVRPRATGHGHARPHQRPPGRRLGDRRPVRALQANQAAPELLAAVGRTEHRMALTRTG